MLKNQQIPLPPTARGGLSAVPMEVWIDHKTSELGTAVLDQRRAAHWQPLSISSYVLAPSELRHTIVWAQRPSPQWRAYFSTNRSFFDYFRTAQEPGLPSNMLWAPAMVSVTGSSPNRQRTYSLVKEAVDPAEHAGVFQNVLVDLSWSDLESLFGGNRLPLDLDKYRVGLYNQEVGWNDPQYYPLPLEVFYHSTAPKVDLARTFLTAEYEPGLAVNTYNFNPHVFAPAGGWVTSSVDLTRLAAALQRGRFVEEHLMPRGFARVMFDQQRGWAASGFPADEANTHRKPRDVWQFNGFEPGSNGLIATDFAEEIAFAVLVNQEIPPGVDQFGARTGGGLHFGIHGSALLHICDRISADEAWPHEDLWPEVGLEPFPELAHGTGGGGGIGPA